MITVKIVEPDNSTKYIEAEWAKIHPVTDDDIYLDYKAKDYPVMQSFYLSYNTKYVSLIIDNVEYYHSRLLKEIDKINAILDQNRIKDAIDSLP